MITPSWRALCHCTDPRQARILATCIAAMEFDVRLRHATSGVVAEDPAEVREGSWLIETDAADWAGLLEVLDQIIEEQAQFDAYLDACDARTVHLRRVFLGSLVVVVAVLATLKLVEL